ncbi:MAG: hypothetical protein ACREHD_19160 [Pirellulales bacterium]
MQSGECRDADSQNEFIENYLASTIRSAAADFYRERGRQALRLRETDDFASQTPSRENDDLQRDLERLQNSLGQLTDDLRIPFRLKYYAAVGPLRDGEVRYVAARSGLVPEEIVKLVEGEFRRHAGRKWPISSVFIGELLGIAAADDGRNTTVDQRIARARTRLRELLDCDG